MVAIRGLVAAATASYLALGNNCPITDYVPSFPAGQTTLVAPSENPKFLGLAFGVQNYTCSSANTFTSTGAVAELIDASCLASTSEYSTIQNDLYNVWTQLVPQSIQTAIDFLHKVNPPVILGQHFFKPNPVTGKGLSPVWDFRSNSRFAGNGDAFVLGAVNGSVPSPTDSTKDVAWLHVLNVQGKLADQIYRYDTVGGQPPTSCNFGKDADISVKYVAKYAFYGGSVN
ncbi:hypothetical protein DICSQDRAFT_163451 [Dichomitus squalens LYAD-421 SS1]|uniref:Malate dehydrogenase n=2 Tax=Dichomitus squalens TaxID=114155 RepID=A0A4Q9Q5H8_9APHY|nr:uncharacterized protein DICSQDRAFT_163451 [Dichomitus squalens LYAD-421 SS1]EJF57394.1 hypothetical protein DICSQDRAFT_163451 [Dichomitus squalens LYAD-421 SS1]TBU27015.1 hypothetical protein BD311DRAFT_697583 [Dichomitus squalens]TBU62673.1 hypothetical protein BD310DRAFT_1036189 [Dichomitus squalens]